MKNTFFAVLALMTLILIGCQPATGSSAPSDPVVEIIPQSALVHYSEETSLTVNISDSSRNAVSDVIYKLTFEGNDVSEISELTENGNKVTFTPKTAGTYTFSVTKSDVTESVTIIAGYKVEFNTTGWLGGSTPDSQIVKSGYSYTLPSVTNFYQEDEFGTTKAKNWTYKTKLYDPKVPVIITSDMNFGPSVEKII